MNGASEEGLSDGRGTTSCNSSSVPGARTFGAGVGIARAVAKSPLFFRNSRLLITIAPPLHNYQTQVLEFFEVTSAMSPRPQAGTPETDSDGPPQSVTRIKCAPARPTVGFSLGQFSKVSAVVDALRAGPEWQERPRLPSL